MIGTVFLIVPKLVEQWETREMVVKRLPCPQGLVVEEWKVRLVRWRWETYEKSRAGAGALSARKGDSEP